MTNILALNRATLKNDAFLSVALRGITLPISAISVILITKTVIDAQGIQNYAIFSLLITLPLLIPISDFGISVAVTDSTAKYGLDSAQFRSTWKKSRQILGLISTATVIISAVMAIMGLWSAVLGIPDTIISELSGFIMGTYLAFSIYLGVGQRLLLGLQKQQITILFSLLAAPLSLFLVFISVKIMDSNLAVTVTAFALGQITAPLACFLYAIKKIPSYNPSKLEERDRGYAVLLRAAAPMTVIAVVLPLTYQSDRVFISHQLDEQALATYSIASTLYMPILSILTIGSQSLWPRFMSTRHDASMLRTSFLKSMQWFTLLSVVLAISFYTIAPYIAKFMSPHTETPPMLYALFGCMILMFGIHSAPGMLLMDFKGRVFQALCSIVMLGLKIPLTILLVAKFGILGAIIGTIIPLFFCMLMPCLILSLLRIRRMYRNA